MNYNLRSYNRIFLHCFLVSLKSLYFSCLICVDYIYTKCRNAIACSNCLEYALKG